MGETRDHLGQSWSFVRFLNHEIRSTKDALSDSTLFFLYFWEKHVHIFRPDSNYIFLTNIFHVNHYHTIASLFLAWLVTRDPSAGLHTLQLPSSHCLLGSELSQSFPLTVWVSELLVRITRSFLVTLPMLWLSVTFLVQWCVSPVSFPGTRTGWRNSSRWRVFCTFAFAGCQDGGNRRPAISGPLGG